MKMSKIIPIVWEDGDTAIIEVRLATNKRIARSIVADMKRESAEDYQNWERYENRWLNGDSWIEIFDAVEVEKDLE
jgi:hypothetical protein